MTDRVAWEGLLDDKIYAEARSRHLKDATQSGFEHHLVRVAAEHGARAAIAALRAEAEPVGETPEDEAIHLYSLPYAELLALIIERRSTAIAHPPTEQAEPEMVEITFAELAKAYQEECDPQPPQEWIDAANAAAESFLAKCAEDDAKDQREQGRRAGMEEAARVCADYAAWHNKHDDGLSGFSHMALGAEECAEKIRALIAKGPGECR